MRKRVVAQLFYKYQYSHMATMLSEQTSIFGVVFLVSRSLLENESQNKFKNITILTRKP